MNNEYPLYFRTSVEFPHQIYQFWLERLCTGADPSHTVLRGRCHGSSTCQLSGLLILLILLIRGAEEKCFHAAKLFGNLEWQQQARRNTQGYRRHARGGRRNACGGGGDCYLLLSPPPPHPGTGLVFWVWCGVLGAGRGGALPSGGEVRCLEMGEVALFTLINTEADKLTVKD